MAKDIKEITEKLEKGVKGLFESERYTEYLSFMTKFHNYSASNCLLIWIQNPTASLVAGYKSWQSKGRQVRKGEKGIQILAPSFHKIMKEIVNEAGEKEEKEIEYKTFHTISVFDVSQTDGEELPSIISELSGEVEGFQKLLEKLQSISPVPVGFEEIASGAKGYFNYVDKRIAIQSGMSEQQTMKTLIHEIAHSILHNKETGEEKDADRKTKEVQAESVAYCVCDYLGLDTSDYSFGYIAGWSSGKEAKELIESTEVIRKTAVEIIEGLMAA